MIKVENGLASDRAAEQAVRVTEVEKLLHSLRGERAVFVPNPGNAGDSFLACVTYQLFTKLGLTYEPGNLSEVYPDRVVICGGGGNLVRPYRDVADFLERNMGRWRQLVILPHTIRAYEETLSRLDFNSFVFCRERPSFEFVTRVAPRARTFLSQDIAFTCDFAKIRRQANDRSLSALNILYRVKRFLNVGGYQAANVRRKFGVLNAFRTDVERTTIDIPCSNIDLSIAFGTGDMSPAGSLHTTSRLIKFIDQFHTIRTNRLHVGIMSAMLGKEVHLYDNSYGKNRDVFIHSMRDRFPNVQWQS
jgi:exopolysaccharide biosynthesis predicted pyruvyltransferase EpsI